MLPKPTRHCDILNHIVTSHIKIVNKLSFDDKLWQDITTCYQFKTDTTHSKNVPLLFHGQPSSNSCRVMMWFTKRHPIATHASESLCPHAELEGPLFWWNAIPWSTTCSATGTLLPWECLVYHLLLYLRGAIRDAMCPVSLKGWAHTSSTQAWTLVKYARGHTNHWLQLHVFLGNQISIFSVYMAQS